MVCWFVTQYRLLLVFILASVIPNIVQRLEPRAGVSVMLLHDLVGNPADLTAEGADQVVGEREQVDILDDSPQGAVRVPGIIFSLEKIFHKKWPHLELTAAVRATSWSPRNSMSGYFLRHSPSTRGSSEAAK